MFRKQYNNNVLFIALVVILLAVIVTFAYLVTKTNRGNQERSEADTAQNNSVENSRNGSEVSPEILKSLNAPESAEENSNSGNNKVTPEVLESLNAPAEKVEINGPEGSSSSSGTIDPEIIKSLNALQ